MIKSYAEMSPELQLAYRSGMRDAGTLAPEIQVIVKGCGTLEASLEGVFSDQPVYRLNVEDLAAQLRRKMLIKGLPEVITLELPGIKPIKKDEPWEAILEHVGSDDEEAPLVVYRVLGDPNAAAVGRFKASLRKFLGVT